MVNPRISSSLQAKKKEVMVDDIPVANLDLPVSLKVSGGTKNYYYYDHFKAATSQGFYCFRSIDHLHYDIIRAKPDGSCSRPAETGLSVS